MSDELSPIEIIAKGRWDNALFTTYALSLTFFETHLIKNCLVKTGCRNIWVVADVDGYQQSLAERQSARVGQEYHLVPVALPNGVFHPKCSYLSGPDGDLLMVSSGNLTFGGFGRNVEVIEMFHSRQNPGVFRQFGEFLQALNNRKDFLNPDSRWVTTFADLALKVGISPAFVTAEEPRLIHCAQDTIFNQIKSVLKSSGGASRLKVLSPFYDAQAGAVQALTKEAKCGRLTIGLLPGREEASAFPFGTKPTGDFKIDAALVSDQLDGRALHAKWFEADLNDGGRVTVTGSTNATQKSLCKTDNIEVSVLRVEPQRTKRAISWKAVPLPKAHQKLEFHKAGIGDRIVVHARIVKHGDLAGSLISSRSVQGIWKAAVVRPDGEMVEFNVDVSADSKFQAAIPHAEHYATQTGLQAVFKRDGLEARGWIQNEEILKLPRLPHLGITSLIRLINNDQTEDDDAALLEYLALSAQQHLTTFKIDARLSKKATSAKGDETEQTPSIELEELKPSSQSGEQLVATDSPEAALDEIFGKLRRRLLRSLGTRKLSASGSPVADDAEDGEGEESGTKPKPVLSGLERFDAAMKMLVETIQDQTQLKAAFNMWLEVELAMFTERLNDDVGAEQFCRRWHRIAASRCRRSETIATFDHHLFTVSASLAGNIICQNQHNADEQIARLVHLHDELERYCGGPVDKSFAASALITEAGRIITEKVRLPAAPELAVSMEQLLSTRTFREEINIVRDCAADKAEPPDDFTIFKTPTGRMLLESLRRRQRIDLVEWSNGRNACPKCHLVLPESVKRTLESERLAVCPHRNHFLVHLKVA
jgi:hypothetical protein